MGYDVTFHPVAVADLERLMFDVVREPKLANKRAKEGTAKAARIAEVADILGRFAGFLEDVDDDFSVAATFGLGAAALAGFRHPYWYARGSALSFLPKLPVQFVSINELSNGLFARLPGADDTRIETNYSASGVILPDQLPALAAWLDAPKHAKTIAKVFDAEGLDSLKRAIAYAREHGLGLMEATDVVVPMTGEGFTDMDNLRAHFIHHLEPGPKPKAKAKPKKRRQRADRRA